MGFTEESHAGIYEKQFRTDEYGHWTYKFSNGFGASVIIISHGGFEVAVLDSKDRICYSTPVTDDVVRAKTFSEVDDILKEIYSLESEKYISISTMLLMKWRGTLKDIDTELTAKRVADGNNVPCYTLHEFIDDLNLRIDIGEPIY